MAYRFHDPHHLLILIALELLEEDRVLTGQVISKRQVVIPCCLFCLALPLERLLVALDILRQQILPADLVVVAEVVDALLGEEADLIERFGDVLLLAPVDIPIVVLGLVVLAGSQGLLDAVGEVGLELYLVAESTQEYYSTG